MSAYKKTKRYNFSVYIVIRSAGNFAVWCLHKNLPTFKSSVYPRFYNKNFIRKSHFYDYLKYITAEF